jgi:conjugal transfer pilus assembly protein TraW
MAYFLIFIFNLFSSFLFAKDLGTYGQTFDVKEVNLIAYMQERIQNLSLEDLKKITQNLNPSFESVKELGEAKIYKKFYFDPTVCSQENIFDHQGKIIVPQGRCVNPLDYVPLSFDLLFLDGNNQEHLNWAKTQQIQSKWILVKGNPLEVEKKEKREIFFDQKGVLSKKLSLSSIPAKVSQSGKFLQIEEIPIQENL